MTTTEMPLKNYNNEFHQSTINDYSLTLGHSRAGRQTERRKDGRGSNTRRFLLLRKERLFKIMICHV